MGKCQLFLGTSAAVVYYYMTAKKLILHICTA